ncbi:15192_t:CDS:2 [Rhizophagus irregularis]|nr:15192_t:CDS:2 [Rhizophagus irregularis]
MWKNIVEIIQALLKSLIIPKTSSKESNEVVVFGTIQIPQYSMWISMWILSGKSYLNLESIVIIN